VEEKEEAGGEEEGGGKGGGYLSIGNSHCSSKFATSIATRSIKT